DQLVGLPKGIRNPCLKPLFWHSRNVGVGCRQRKSHPPKWRVTISSPSRPVARQSSGLPSTRPSLNTHSSRSGSVQRILSVVPAPRPCPLCGFFLERAPPIECSSITLLLKVPTARTYLVNVAAS